MNVKMPDLRRAFECAGFKNVVTVISSGNVVFDAEHASVRALQRRVEAAMQKRLGRSFVTVIRPVKGLQKLRRLDPFKSFTLPSNSKSVITLLRDRPSRRLRLPIEKDGAIILAMKGGMIFSAYVAF